MNFLKWANGSSALWLRKCLSGSHHQVWGQVQRVTANILSTSPLTTTKENFGQKAKWFCVPNILHFLWLWHWSKFPVRWSDTRMTINLSVSISRLIYCQSRPGSHFLCRHHTTGSKSQKAVKTCKGFLKFFCEGECTENVHFAKSKNIIIPNFSTFFLIQHPNQLLFKWWRIV